jgi:hypothetical protein
MRHHVLLVRGGDETSGVKNPSAAEVFFYPNPSKNVLRASQPIARPLDVYDVNGKFISTLVGHGVWDISVLKPGAYTIRYSGAGKSFPILVE